MNSQNSKQKGENISVQTHSNVHLTGTYFDSPSDKGIILFPGFTEHRSSLFGLAEKLNQNGFKAWSFDINSQGESTGNWDLNEMAESVYDVQDQLRKKHGLKKMGAFGNSIGGMAVTIAAGEDNKSLDVLCVSTMGNSLQQYVPKFIMNIARRIPQSAIRQATIALDRILTWSNENYRKTTHPQFKTAQGYKQHAQFGALKVDDIKDFFRMIDNAPSVDDYIHMVNQPLLFIYGGNDRFLGFYNDEVPEKIQALFSLTKSKNKKMLIIPGADHSFNKKTRVDDCFNQSSEFAYVKDEIVAHFIRYLS